MTVRTGWFFVELALHVAFGAIILHMYFIQLQSGDGVLECTGAPIGVASYALSV